MQSENAIETMNFNLIKVLKQEDIQFTWTSNSKHSYNISSPSQNNNGLGLFFCAKSDFD